MTFKKNISFFTKCSLTLLKNQLFACKLIIAFRVIVILRYSVTTFCNASLPSEPTTFPYLPVTVFLFSLFLMLLHSYSCLFGLHGCQVFWHLSPSLLFDTLRNATAVSRFTCKEIRCAQHVNIALCSDSAVRIAKQIIFIILFTSTVNFRIFLPLIFILLN